MLAIAFYDDEKRASFIVKANPKHMGTLIFETGVKLRIPILDIIDIPETLPPWRR